MRPGIFISVVGHIGIFLISRMVWEATPPRDFGQAGSVVPVEIVDISEVSNVRALYIPDPEGDPLIADEAVEEAAAPEPTPEAEATPTPTPQPRQTAPPTRFSLNNLDTKTGAQNDGDASDIDRAGAGAQTAATAAETDLIGAISKAHVRRLQCFRSYDDLANADTLVVILEWDMDRNGAMRGQPRRIEPRVIPPGNPEMRVAVDRAINAVRQCDPFPFADDPRIGQRYEVWRTIRMRFTASPGMQ